MLERGGLRGLNGKGRTVSGYAPQGHKMNRGVLSRNGAENDSRKRPQVLYLLSFYALEYSIELSHGNNRESGTNLLFGFTFQLASESGQFHRSDRQERGHPYVHHRQIV